MALTPQQKQVMHEVHLGLKQPRDLQKAGLTQQQVSDEFGAGSKVMQEFQLLVRSRAHQVGLPELLAVKEEFLQAAGDYYQHRTAKRAFKKTLRKGTLAKVRKDLERREEQLRKKKAPTQKDRQRLDKLQQLKQKLREHEELKAAHEKEYNRVRRKFIDLVDERIEYLEGQVKFAGHAIVKPLGALDTLRDAQRKRIREANAVFVEQWRREARWAFFESPHRAQVERTLQLGPDKLTDAELGAVPHPYEETPAQLQAYDQFQPLRRLKVLDRQREMLSYQYDVLRGELRQLRQMRRIISNSAAMWEFVDSIEKWLPRLQQLALSVTEFQRPIEVLAGSAPSALVQLNRSTGSRDFTLELGAAYGIEKDVATLDLGLAVVLSGSLSVGDDRRVKASLSLQLVPSFTAAIETPVLTFELAANLGFTITSQAYSFVDERHFAYYMAFRIANLLMFRDRFTRYGKVALHQHVGAYTPELQALLKRMVGDAKFAEMQSYLTEKPVIKSTLLDNWKPDLGFSGSLSVGLEAIDEEVGAGISGSVSLKHRTLFERSQLVMPADGEQPYILTSRRRGTTWSYTFGAEGQATSWLTGSIEFNVSKIDNDANPDNNGKYLTITIQSEPFGLVPGMLPVLDPKDGDPPFFHLLRGSGAAKAALNLVALRDAVVGAVKIAANAAQARAYDSTQNWSLGVGEYFEIAHSTERALVIACQIGDDGDVTIMYIRWTYTTGTSISASGAAETPYGDVAISGSAAWSKTVTLQEWLGPSSMAYLQPAFNGYRLRPGGRQQWQALLDQHPRGLRAIFRNIGKPAGSPDKELAVRKEVKGYEEMVEEYKHIWQPRPYWDASRDAGTGQSSFVALCEAKRGALKQPLEPGKVGALKRRFRRVPGATLAELDTLKKELTTLLWRREQVMDHLEALKAPWQQRRTYLEEATGELYFRLRWDGQQYRVIKAPRFKPVQGSRYRGVEDLYTNPKLYGATSLRPFYEDGFDVFLKIERRKKHPLPGAKPYKTMFTMRLRAPHGADTFERAYRSMIAVMMDAAQPDTERLRALVRLHPRLSDHTSRWILEQEARGDAKAAQKQMKSAQRKAAVAAEPSKDDVQRKGLDKAIKLLDDWLLNPRSPASAGGATADPIVEALASVKSTFVGFRAG